MGSLIDEIRSGNKDAVKAIYQEYAKDVYNFAKSITGDHDTALAATKKTFVKMFNNIKRGENPDNIRTALLKVAYDESCKIAMPSDNKPASAQGTGRTQAATGAKRRPQKREEIYMPKGGYDSLQVDENPAAEEEDVTPRRPRPENSPRRRRPVVEEADEEMEDEEVSTVRQRRPRRIEEDIPEEEIAPRNRVLPEEEDVVEEDEFEEEKPRQKKTSKASKYDDDDEEDVDVYDPLDDEYDDDEDYDDDVKPRSKGLFIFCIILNVVLILILLWFLCGLLINLGVLPEFDLGYTWFNGHIYPLF